MSPDPALLFNRLLAYRSREQLARMDDGERARLFAQIAAQGPSKEAWDAIYELFALWPGGTARTANIDAAAHALAAWDDALRFKTSDARSLYERDGLSELAGLVKSIEVYRRDQYGASELRAIVTSPQASRLTRLAIRRSDIGSAWNDLVTSPHLSNLEHLHVAKTDIQDEGLRSFFRSANLPRLCCLKLTEVGLNAAALDGVRHSIPFAQLRRLDLSANFLRDEGAAILAHAPWLANIEKLSLADNGITAAALLALLQSPHCERLQALDVTGNRVTGADKSALVSRAQRMGIDLRV
jgi:hypothetical protein